MRIIPEQLAPNACATQFDVALRKAKVAGLFGQPRMQRLL